jgi:uncharacterized protein YlaI
VAIGIVQCFKCERHVEAAASKVVLTTDAESYGARPIERLWCGSCLREVAENTEEAVKDLEKVIDNEVEISPDDEVTGWTKVESFDEVREYVDDILGDS